MLEARTRAELEAELWRGEYRTACASRYALLGYFSWLATAPFRFLSLHTPEPLRRLARRSLTSRLYNRLEMRREYLRQARLITESSLFDSAWYSQRYPDVLTSGSDPALHYVMYGAAEGRNPGPRFDAEWYVQTHPDVARAQVNPLVHYLTHGLIEGRQIRATASSPPKF